MKANEIFKLCMSQPANCVLRVLDKNWKSYFVAIKDWKQHPEKYVGVPKLPKYLKKNGVLIPTYTIYIINMTSLLILTLIIWLNVAFLSGFCAVKLLISFSFSYYISPIKGPFVFSPFIYLLTLFYINMDSYLFYTSYNPGLFY